MNKILIPQKFIKINHKQVQLNNEDFSKQESPFSKQDSHYVLDLTNTNKIYHDFEPNFFKNLNIKGIFEINSNQDINLMIVQIDPNDPNKKSDYADFIPCKKIIFNADSQTLHLTFDLWSESINNNLQKLEELEINFNSCNLDLRKASSLKKLIINSKKIYDLQLSAPNLKELSLKHLNIINSASWSNEDIRFDNLKLPDKCRITLSKDLKWKFQISPSDPLTISLKNTKDAEVSLSDMINSFKPKSLIKNEDGTYSLRFDDLKNMLTATKFKLYEDFLKDAKKIITTQRQITDSMIKPSKINQEIKEK